jgi:glycosyltransferase involved in cell wall biosynthesis
MNEESQLPITSEILGKKYEQLFKDGLINPSSRVLFVDDGSTDKTWKTITDLNSKFPKVFCGIKLAHNSGHQNAVYAGLMETLTRDCDAAISLDADLQDDPNAIDQMIQNFNAGDDIVYGVRDSRSTDSWFKRFSAGIFYGLFAKLDTETVKDHADFRLMSRRAIEALSQYTEVSLFLRGIVPALGFKTSKVFYQRGIRQAGESKYPLKKMLSFAFTGITSFSVKPLRFVIYAGIVSIIIAIVSFIYVICSLVRDHAVPGWGSMMFSIWFIGGGIMLSLGIIGEYIGKIYLEAKRRPRYIIEERTEGDNLS